MREKLETLSVSVLRDFAKDKKIKNKMCIRDRHIIGTPASTDGINAST